MMASGPGAFSVREEQRNGILRLTVAGELDIGTVPELEKHLASKREGLHGILLDLTAVSFMDSTGLHALLQARDQATSSSYRLAVVGIAGAARKVLEITRTAEILTDPKAAAELLDLFNGRT